MTRILLLPFACILFAALFLFGFATAGLCASEKLDRVGAFIFGGR